MINEKAEKEVRTLGEKERKVAKSERTKHHLSAGGDITFPSLALTHHHTAYSHSILAVTVPGILH
jgi:hypothetical protein